MTNPLTLDDLVSAALPAGRMLTRGRAASAVRAILTTIKEAGFKIVPVEASEEMNIAGHDAEYDVAFNAEVVWRAMQSAAPKIEGE